MSLAAAYTADMAVRRATGASPRFARRRWRQAYGMSQSTCQLALCRCFHQSCRFQALLVKRAVDFRWSPCRPRTLPARAALWWASILLSLLELLGLSLLRAWQGCRGLRQQQAAPRPCPGCPRMLQATTHLLPAAGEGRAKQTARVI